MTPGSSHCHAARPNRLGWWLLLAAFVLTLAVYWPGLSGGFLFDDYPNIVDNHGVQPPNTSFSSLVGAALSSPSSEFKRPLASLSFAANYLATGLDPYWMKVTNLVIHLLNGLLVFLLARSLILLDGPSRASLTGSKERPTVVGTTSVAMPLRPDDIGTEENPNKIIAAETAATAPAYGAGIKRAGVVAALIAGSWMLLPINLTGVLYVVQRMESLANLFVLLGLIGYVAGRRRMLESLPDRAFASRGTSSHTGALLLCLFSITVPTAIGILAKETAVMIPLYALLIEWILFGFQHPRRTSVAEAPETPPARRSDRRIIALFVLVLVLPMALGLAWLLPGVFNPEVWATRDFTLGTRLLSEARIIVDYVVWTLLPTPDALSFYHDDFHISSGLLTPWTTLASIVFLGALIALMLGLRRHRPLAALGIALFLGCQLLTGTILPLELIYEHRNYFASFGLLLAIVPLLAAPSSAPAVAVSPVAGLPMALPRYTLLTGLMLCWTALTAMTAYAWGNPLRLAADLASRASLSPRAQYELGRTYVIYSHYDPASPFTKLAYAPLEKAAALPHASILAEQALIFMNSRMHLPLKDAWWDSLIAKLSARKPGVQDESALSALTQCAHERHCDLPKDRMMQAFTAALTHPDPSARLLATYGDYAWNVLDDHVLGLRMLKEAVKTSPDESAYQVTLIRMQVALGHQDEARQALQRLGTLNIGGQLNGVISELDRSLSQH